ncbi:MAG TPA: NUDIX hydrolase [Candidatus Paceibacterota bacterium]|nr:NUDIX hydrolase [Candidatus Paceibacterota bacterium]
MGKTLDKENIEIVAAQKAALKVGNKFLILRRSDTTRSFPGAWDFPGGKIEEGESPEEGLCREVKEETGLEIRSTGIQGTYDGEIRNTPVRFAVHSAELVSGDFKNTTVSEEHSEQRLATAEEISHMKTMPYVQQYLEENPH